MKVQAQRSSTSPAGGRARSAKPSRQLTPLAGIRSRVLVVEDHPLMRRSLVEAIERETDLTVCGQAEDAQQAFAAVVSVQPDLVLTDIQLKSSSGLDFIKAVHAHAPALPVVAMTMFDVRRTERLARAAGASAFVAKQDGPGRLIEVVRASLKNRKPQPEPGESEDA
ncbi:MAG: response regulator transcription factor [Limisphaerales bacterium]